MSTENMKRAKKFKVYDENGNELKEYKNVANEENEQESFSMVKNGYHVIQHEDVFNTVKEAIEDKNLNAIVRPHRDYNGDSGRLHIEARFPDISVDVENNGIQAQMFCTYDNSYDGTTGLRLGVGATIGNTVLWVEGARYYHKHTKSVSVVEFEKQLEKGIKAFQDQIKNHFKAMFATKVTQVGAETFLDDAMNIKGVSKKYVEAVLSKVKQSTIKNKWQLYKIVCEVISDNSSSIDVRDRQLKAIVGKMHKTFKSTNLTSLITPPQDEGITLTEAYSTKTEEVTTQVTESPRQDVPEGLIGLTLQTNQPPKLTVLRKGKRQYAVMQGDTELKTFRKHKQAQKFMSRAA